MAEVTLILPPTADHDPFESAEARRQRIRRKQRLTRAAKNLPLAFERGWHHDPKLTAGLLDCAEQQAFLCERDALETARRMVEVADTSGDPHLYNRSVGVLACAYMAHSDRYWAGKTLDDDKLRILDCCPDCRSEYFRREGDLLAEERKAAEALVAFRRAFDERGGVFTADDFGRFCFNRSLGFHFRGERTRALADLADTLRHTSLESPRGYFVDSPAMAAVYVLGGDPCHDRQALAMVEGLRKRIQGCRWPEALTRMLWVQGLLHARLGHCRRGRRCLKAAHRRLLKHGLAREAVAVSLDLGQLAVRHWDPGEQHVAAAEEAISACLERRDLRGDHLVELKRLRDKVLKDYPYEAFRLLGELRCSFIAPVPSRLDERVEQR